MAKKMAVVPFDLVKDMIKAPPQVERLQAENALARKLNLAFDDDFGRRQKKLPKFTPASQQQSLYSSSAETENYETAGHETPEQDFTENEAPSDDDGDYTLHPTSSVRYRQPQFVSTPLSSRLKKTLFAGPHSSLKVKLKILKVIDDRGRVLNKNGGPFKNSNIDKVIDFLDDKITRKPPGTDFVLDRINNLGIKTPFKKTQTGRGIGKWIKI